MSEPGSIGNMPIRSSRMRFEPARVASGLSPRRSCPQPPALKLRQDRLGAVHVSDRVGSRFSRRCRAPPRGDGPICASQGHTAEAGASMSIARVETPSASSSSSSPGRRAAASASVAPQFRIGRRRRSRAWYSVPAPIAAPAASQAASPSLELPHVSLHLVVGDRLGHVHIPRVERETDPPTECH